MSGRSEKPEGRSPTRAALFQEAALLAKISNIQVVSEQDLLAEEARDRSAALGRLNSDVHRIHECFADIHVMVAEQVCTDPPAPLPPTPYPVVSPSNN